MRMRRFFFLLGQGIKNIFTHGFMSFASVAVITACLFIMGCFSLLTLNIDNMIAEMQSQNRVIAYVDEALSEDEARALESKVSKVKNIETCEFVTREEAMTSFESDYDADLFENIDSSVFRHRYVLSLTDLSLMQETKADLEGIDGIADVRAHLDYAEKFVTLRNIVSIVSVILVVTLPGEGKEVGGSHDARLLDVSHGAPHEIKSLPADGTPHVTLPSLVATGDEHHLPEPQLIEVLMAADSHLAYEVLVLIVGGYAFFLPPFFSVVSCLMPSGTRYHSSRSSTTVAMSSCISAGVKS